MNNIELQKFIEEKSNRQIVLQERMKLLNTLQEDLSSSKIGRWFGNAYLITKRFMALSLGILLILGAILFFFFPQIIVKDDTVKNEIIQDYKTRFAQETGASLQIKIKEIAPSSSSSKTNVLVQNIDKSIQESIQNNTQNKFQFMAILVLIIGLILLYLAHVIKQIKVRNTKIAEAENLTKAINNDYKLTIEEEDKELLILRDYLSKMS